MIMVDSIELFTVYIYVLCAVETMTKHTHVSAQKILYKKADKIYIYLLFLHRFVTLYMSLREFLDFSLKQ